MSTNRDDILESIADEKTRELASVLMAYRPKIAIDRDFQHALRKQLTTQTQKSRKSLRDIAWFGWMTSIAMVSASLVAVIGLYQIFQSSTLTTRISPKRTTLSVAGDTRAVYTEEKALEFADAPPPMEIKKPVTPVESIGANTATAEIVNIDAEIEDIARELLSEAAVQRPSSRPTLRETPAMASMQMAATPPISSVSGPIIPAYPSMMNLYSKPTPWESYEIAGRSGSGLTTQIVRTEKSDAIEARSRTLIGDRAIISATTIYLPLAKIVRDTLPRYYLVPIIDYRLEGEIHVYVPLVRGFR